MLSPPRPTWLHLGVLFTFRRKAGGGPFSTSSVLCRSLRKQDLRAGKPAWQQTRFIAVQGESQCEQDTGNFWSSSDVPWYWVCRACDSEHRRAPRFWRHALCLSSLAVIYHTCIAGVFYKSYHIFFIAFTEEELQVIKRPLLWLMFRKSINIIKYMHSYRHLSFEKRHNSIIVSCMFLSRGRAWVHPELLSVSGRRWMMCRALLKDE